VRPRVATPTPQVSCRSIRPRPAERMKRRCDGRRLTRNRDRSRPASLAFRGPPVSRAALAATCVTDKDGLTRSLGPMAVTTSAAFALFAQGRALARMSRIRVAAGKRVCALTRTVLLAVWRWRLSLTGSRRSCCASAGIATGLGQSARVLRESKRSRPELHLEAGRSIWRPCHRARGSPA
jgi:hypothetical protein